MAQSTECPTLDLCSVRSRSRVLGSGGLGSWKTGAPLPFLNVSFLIFKMSVFIRMALEVVLKADQDDDCHLMNQGAVAVMAGLTKRAAGIRVAFPLVVLGALPPSVVITQKGAPSPW